MKKTAEEIVMALAALPRPEKAGGHGDPRGCELCGGEYPGGPCKADCVHRMAREWRLSKIKFGPQLRTPLLDLCCEFDAIDLSECNRRLEAGEKFDEACDAVMEKRTALGEQIKERLGELFSEFEALHDALNKERGGPYSPLDPKPAETVARQMAYVAAHELRNAIHDRGQRPNLKQYLTRLGVLLS